MIAIKNVILTLLLVHISFCSISQNSLGFTSDFSRSYYRDKNHRFSRWRGELQDHIIGLGIDYSYVLHKIGPKTTVNLRNGITYRCIIPMKIGNIKVPSFNLIYLSNSVKIAKKNTKLEKSLGLNYEILLNKKSLAKNFKLFYPAFTEIEFGFKRPLARFEFLTSVDLSPENSLTGKTMQLGEKVRFFYYGVKVRYELKRM